METVHLRHRRTFALPLCLVLGLAAGAQAATPTATATSATAQASAPEAVFDDFTYTGSDPADARFPPAPGQFANPVLKGFYPDPSVVRVGGDYYLVNSTFGWFPGIPVFHSTDLVHWTQLGNAIDRTTQLDFGAHDLVNGVFAPSIEHHDGRFWIANTCFPACGGNFVITATDPAGPWSDPVWLPDLAGGIDPSLFFDDDGRAWIVNNDVPDGPLRYEGHRAIWLQQFDPRAMRTTGPRTVILDGGIVPSEKPEYVEGPHLFKRDGWYYLTAAEGGTGEMHRQVVLRSRQVTGPYEAWSGNPVLTQRDLPRGRELPVTSAGHADFIQTADGAWWAVFLGNRPYPPVQAHHVNTGRETFLLPVTWTADGWPRIGQADAPVPYALDAPHLPAGKAAVPTSGSFTLDDAFDGPALPPYWITPRNPRTAWHRLAGGALHVQAREVRLGDRGNPSLLARRQQHQQARVGTTLRFSPQRDGDSAGLAAFQNENYWYLLALTRERGRLAVVLDRRDGRRADEPATGTRLASAPLPEAAAGQPLQLRIRAEGARYAFDYAAGDGQWRTLAADIDGTLLSTAVAGGFTGAVFGVYAGRAPL